MGKKQKHNKHGKKNDRAETTETKAPKTAAVFVSLDQGNQLPSDLLNLLGSTSPPIRGNRSASGG